MNSFISSDSELTCVLPVMWMVFMQYTIENNLEAVVIAAAESKTCAFFESFNLDAFSTAFMILKTVISALKIRGEDKNSVLNILGVSNVSVDSCLGDINALIRSSLGAATYRLETVVGKDLKEEAVDLLTGRKTIHFLLIVMYVYPDIIIYPLVLLRLVTLNFEFLTLETISLIFRLVTEYSVLLEGYENLLYVVLDITFMIIDKEDFDRKFTLVETILYSVQGSSISQLNSSNLLKLTEKLLTEHCEEFYEISVGFLHVLADKALAFLNKHQYLYCMVLVLKPLNERFTKLGLDLIVRVLGYDLVLDNIGYQTVCCGVKSLRPSNTKKFQADTKEIYVHFIQEFFNYFLVSRRFDCPGFLDLCTDVLEIVLSPTDSRYPGYFQDTVVLFAKFINSVCF